MSKINTDLEVHVTLLQDYYAGRHKETKYHLKYFPSRLIYQDDLKDCNEVVQEYAFKVQRVDTIEEVFEIIKELYEKVLPINLMRLDILFEARESAHLSKERRHDSNARIILDDKFIAYNKQIEDQDRQYLLYKLLEFKGFLSMKTC